MSGIISNLGCEILAVFLVGIVVKLMDDYLDLEIDKLMNKTTLAGKLGRGILPYILLVFALALTANQALTLTLFLASYGIGMYKDLQKNLPFGLKGWQETVLALVLGALLVDWSLMVWATAVMTGIQLYDDFIDYKQDKKSGVSKLAHRIGPGETLVLSLIMLNFSLFFYSKGTFMVLILAPLVNWLMGQAGQEGKG